VDTLDAFEAAIAGAEAELVTAVGDHEFPAPSAPSVSSAALAALPSLASLPRAVAGATVVRAMALAQRQAELIDELRAALALVRRHLDLLDAVAEPPARPRFVDQFT